MELPHSPRPTEEDKGLEITQFTRTLKQSVYQRNSRQFRPNGLGSSEYFHLRIRPDGKGGNVGFGFCREIRGLYSKPNFRRNNQRIRRSLVVKQGADFMEGEFGELVLLPDFPKQIPGHDG